VSLKKEKESESEFERPPNSKIKITVTIDDKLLNQMKSIQFDEVKTAEEADRVAPDWSNTVEMLLRKGVKAYRTKPGSVR